MTTTRDQHPPTSRPTPPPTVELEFHRAADLFPLIEVGGSEFGDLVADIREHGLLLPIVLHDGPSQQLMFGKSSPYYNWYHRDLEYSFRQAKFVPLESARTVRLSDEPTTIEVRDMFQELGLELPSAVTDDDVGDIERRALHAKNPYP